MNKDVAEIIDLVGRMNGGMRCPGHTKPGEVCNMCYRPPKEKRKIMRGSGPRGFSIGELKRFKPKPMVEAGHNSEWVYWEGYIKGFRDGWMKRKFDVDSEQDFEKLRWNEEAGIWI